MRKIPKRIRHIAAAISLICAFLILLVPFLIMPFENYAYYRKLLEKITRVNLEKGQDSF